MEKKTGAKIKLGIFVTIGLLIFIIAVYTIGKQQRIFGTYFNLNAVFYDVSGLQVGNNVRFAGIRIGTVSDILILSDTLVKVEMIIEQKIREFIKKDAKAVIGSEGLMGNKVVNILPGTMDEEIVQSNDLILSEKAIDIDNILVNLQETMGNIQLMTKDLATITSSVAAGKGIVGTLLMDTVISSQLEKSLKNIQEGTRGFEENMEALQDNILFRGYFRKKEKGEEKNEKQKKNEEPKEDKDSEESDKKKKKGLFGNKKNNN